MKDQTYHEAVCPMCEGKPAPREFIGLTLKEMDEIIAGNVTITDSRLRDGVYGVVLDTISTLMDKNPWLVETDADDEGGSNET